MGDRIWTEFSKGVVETLGPDKFCALSGRLKLRSMFDRWLIINDVHIQDETDIEDAAGDFREMIQDHLEEATQAAPKVRKDIVSYPLKNGSLQSIVAYAEALPIVLKARQDVLGCVEPLSSEEAEQWLQRETTGPARTVVEITYKFSIPESASWLNEKVMQAIGQGKEVVSLYEAVADPSEIAPGIRRPSICPKHRLISRSLGERNQEVDLLDCRSPKVEALVRWADRLAARCVGEMPLDLGDKPVGFEQAVSLILAGVWPRIAIYGVRRSERAHDRSFTALPHTHRCQVPYIAINILALDVTHTEVASTFQHLRGRAGVGGKKMEAEAEILCLAALEALEMDGFGKEDSDDFRRAVLERYSVKARMHGVDQDKYGGRAGWTKARKTLERVENNYRDLYSRSTFPVQTPNGPRTLVSKEPDLFSRDADPVKRIVK